MPIGKNAIKRVENNGYSKVKTDAPDMENSHVIAKPDEQVVEKLLKPVEKAAAAPKKCASTKSSAKKPAAKKTANKAVKTPVAAVEAQDGFKRVEVGTDMPYYLL